MDTEKQALQLSLAFVYRLIVASEDLLMRAIAKTPPGALHDYFCEHLNEETGHAQMLAADLARLGMVQIPAFHLAELMAGSQYYLIEHAHPAALLGYMAALESNPLTLATVDSLEAKYGRLDCLRLHATRDPIHAPEVRKQIDALPADVQPIAHINFLRTVQQLQAAPRTIFANLAPGVTH